MSEYEKNYFPDVEADPAGLRYRLEGDDVIKAVITNLRGGLIKTKDGYVYNEAYRHMNEEGIARVEFFLRGGVNKINHITKYKNEERVMRQMRALARAFTIELTENLKYWAPAARVVQEEKVITLNNGRQETVMVNRLVNSGIDKVRNKGFVQQVVENALLQSMQRGQEGFEAELTGKSWMVTEQVGGPQRPEDKQRLLSGLTGLFGRRRNDEYG